MVLITIGVVILYLIFIGVLSYEMSAYLEKKYDYDSFPLFILILLSISFIMAGLIF